MSIVARGLGRGFAAVVVAAGLGLQVGTPIQPPNDEAAAPTHGGPGAQIGLRDWLRRIERTADAQSQPPALQPALVASASIEEPALAKAPAIDRRPRRRAEEELLLLLAETA